MKTASWVVRVKESKEVLFETFSAQLVSRLNVAKYEAVPILQYLVELNAALKEEACDPRRHRQQPTPHPNA